MLLPPFYVSLSLVDFFPPSCPRTHSFLHTQTFALLQGLHLVNTSTGEKSDLPVAGLFYGIGHQPNSKLVAGQVDLDEAGYVKVSWRKPAHPVGRGR